MTLLEAALEYADLGWNVFPCTPRGKTPATRHGCKDATTDKDQIRKWWAENPAYNVAIATGAGSGLVVLDLDPNKGGVRPQGTPTTLRVRTGSGGEHDYFSHPGGHVGNSASKVATGVDVRGDGGYVIGPPSVHPSGGTYEWVNQWDDELPVVPGFIARPVERIEVADSVSFGPASIGVLQAAAEALQKHGPAIEGKGGDQHTFVAGGIVFQDFGLSEDEGMPLMLAWNASCSPPWDEAELAEKVLGRDYKGEHGRRRKVVEARLQMAAKWPGILRGKTPATDEEIAPAPVEPGEFGEALEYVRAEMAKRTGSAAVREHLGAFTSLAELSNMPETTKDYLIENAVGVREFGMLGGEAKATKTWFALELAVAIASGTRACGIMAVPKKGRVALLLTEDTSGSALRRIKALLATRDLTDAQRAEAMGNIFVHCRQRTRVTDDDDLAHLIARCLVIDPVLVVMDPLVNLHEADEDKAAGMSPVMERIMWVRDIVGASVLLTHHTGKRNEMTGKLRGGQRMRGSSALHGHVEFGFYFLETDTKDAPHAWESVVETETKDGASMGVFKLRLDVEDGPAGGAVRAAFTISRDMTPTSQGDDQRILDALELHESRAQKAGQEPTPLSYAKIGALAKVGHSKAKRILEDQLVPSEKVRLVLNGRAPKGYVLNRRDLSMGTDVASKFLK